MRIPDPLRAAIDDELARVDRHALARAVAQLSERYRAGKFAGAMSNAVDRAAYLVTRLPATYAAGAYVFSELARRVSAPAASLLDLGSGPGTAMWAAAESVASITQFTAVERDASLTEIGRRLAARSSKEALRRATWRTADLRSLGGIEAHDVVVLSYALGELPDAFAAVAAAWGLAKTALVIVEPGTPHNFQAVLQARDALLAAGASIAAPCPHHNACPLALRNDWCHFSVRLERTAEHRRLKGGELGYEDEKFSYVIACKPAAEQAATRIVRHPMKHPGHIKLMLCTPDGLQMATITKSQKELYRRARQAKWGEEWQRNAEEEL